VGGVDALLEGEDFRHKLLVVVGELAEEGEDLGGD